MVIGLIVFLLKTSAAVLILDPMMHLICYSISCSYGQVNFERGILSLIIHFDPFFFFSFSVFN
jgi:hypothetical protein